MRKIIVVFGIVLSACSAENYLSDEFGPGPDLLGIQPWKACLHAPWQQVLPSTSMVGAATLDRQQIGKVDMTFQCYDFVYWENPSQATFDRWSASDQAKWLYTHTRTIGTRPVAPDHQKEGQ